MYAFVSTGTILELNYMYILRPSGVKNSRYACPVFLYHFHSPIVVKWCGIEVVSVPPGANRSGNWLAFFFYMDKNSGVVLVIFF